jgi:isocitrate/isopropylmalate dehydrogenase
MFGDILSNEAAELAGGLGSRRPSRPSFEKRDPRIW